MGLVCEIEQKGCQKWDFSAKVEPMQKKQNKNRNLRTAFAFAATALMTCSVMPILADSNSLSDAKEVHVYALSSSDSDPEGTLKTEMIEQLKDTGVTLDAASSTLSVTGLDRSKTGIQNVTLNLSTGKDTLSANYTENAAVTVAKDNAPVIQLSTDTVNLYNDDTFNASSYIRYLYDASGKLPVLRITSNVDTSVTGTYTATYSVVNLEGKTSTATLTVNVTGPSPEALAAQAAAEAAEKAAEEAAVQAAAAASYTSAGNTQYGTAGANPYSGGWSNCTWSAWQLVYNNLGISMPNFGNASEWVASAQARGYATGTSARAGSVAVYQGHVAYVAAVSADGSQCYIMEGGYGGAYNERWISVTGSSYLSLIGYIYF